MALDRGWVQRLVLRLEVGLDGLGHGALIGEDSRVWGGGQIVFFDHLRSDPRLGHQFLLRTEMVRQQPLQLPDPVQQVQFTGGVVAVVADGLSDDVPVLLLHMGAIVLVPRPRPGERGCQMVCVSEGLPI